MLQAISQIVQELRGLGESVFRLVKAELELVLEMWRRSLIELGKGIALLGAAFYVLVLLAPLLAVFAAIDGLSDWLDWPYWASALVVLGVVLLVGLVLALVAKRILTRRFENPAVILSRRLDDQRGWWHERVMYLEKSLPAGAAGRGELDDDFDR
jgi:MFS family permease